MCEKRFSLRTKFLLSFLLTWAAVAAAHVFFYSTVKREALNAEGESLAWREGSIPAIRGRILDRQGTPLAWTELHHDLKLVKMPLRDSRRRNLAQALEKLPFKISQQPSMDSKDLILKSSLTPEQLATCEHALCEFQELEIVPRLERRAIDYPEVKRLLGRTAPEGGEGRLLGLDGEERTLDRRLAGREGRFKVMLDKNGRWVDGTLKILEQPHGGEDIGITYTVQEIKDGVADGRL